MAAANLRVALIAALAQCVASAKFSYMGYNAPGGAMAPEIYTLEMGRCVQGNHIDAFGSWDVTTDIFCRDGTLVLKVMDGWPCSGCTVSSCESAEFVEFMVAPEDQGSLMAGYVSVTYDFSASSKPPVQHTLNFEESLDVERCPDPQVSDPKASCVKIDGDDLARITQAGFRLPASSKCSV